MVILCFCFFSPASLEEVITAISDVRLPRSLYHLCQEGYVTAGVCLVVSKITRNAKNRL